MLSIKQIIIEEIMNTTANFPEFGERLLNLNEIGEGSVEPYDYDFENISYLEVHYNFDTEDGDEYIVYVVNTDRPASVWEMEFGVTGHNYKSVLDKGRMYRVLATILKIVNDFIDKYKPNVLKFEPSKTRGDNDMRRYNLYMQYVKKNIRPDYFAYEYPPFIVIERKIKTPRKEF